MTSNDLVPEISRSGFNDFTKEGLVLIDFWATWCMPCLTMAPIVDELSEKFKGKIKFGKVNIEENADVAEKFDVVSIPNFILFKDGNVVEQKAGSMSADEFEEILNQHI